MSGLPDDLTEAWWGTERAVPIVHALDALLDRLEEQLSHDDQETADLPTDLLPLSTGLLPLDRVLGGGVWRGSLTLVEADMDAQGAALLNTVVRLAPHRCLVDGPRFFDVVVGLLAGSAGVPEVGISDACLSEREWSLVVAGLRRLHERDVFVCSTGSLAALAETAVSVAADLLVVHAADRLGPADHFVPRLAELASNRGVAVLASMAPTDHLPERLEERVTRLGMHSHDFGGRASLIRPDPDELLAVAQVDVECLFGVVR